MSLRIALLALGFLCFSCSGPSCETIGRASGSADNKFQFFAKAEDCESQILLRLTIRNLADEPVSLRPQSIPWRNYSAAHLKVTNLRTGDLLEGISLIQDVWGDPMAVSPGEEITGTIPLHDIYSELGLIDDNRFRVEWRMKLVDLDGNDYTLPGAMDIPMSR